MAYINSSNIEVFPSARRGGTNPESRLFAESSVVSIVNKLIDTDGFVISTNLSEDPFEFNIQGYYFKVDSYTSIVSLGSGWTEVYGSVNLTESDFPEINSDNNSNKYTGVNFTNTQPVGKYLKLLEKVNGTWVIPEESKIKFNVAINSIDGGII